MLKFLEGFSSSYLSSGCDAANRRARCMQNTIQVTITRKKSLVCVCVCCVCMCSELSMSCIVGEGPGGTLGAHTFTCGT